MVYQLIEVPPGFAEPTSDLVIEWDERQVPPDSPELTHRSAGSASRLGCSLAVRRFQRNKASPSIASLNRPLTGFSLNQVVAWVRKMDGLRRALAA